MTKKIEASLSSVGMYEAKTRVRTATKRALSCLDYNDFAGASNFLREALAECERA